MKRYLVLLALLASFAGAFVHAAEPVPAPTVFSTLPADADPAQKQAFDAFKNELAFDAPILAVTQGPQVTIVHFWAPWCSNCKHELQSGAWTTFVTSHPEVKVIFITVWNDKQGRADLAKYGLGSQANFTSYLHPNPSRTKENKVSTVLGLPLTWIPSTWIFKNGKLFYALNYGELHFDMLQQLVADSSASW